MSDTTTGTTGSVKETAANVAGEAKDAGGRVAGTAKEGAARVASEAKGQTRQLLSQAGDEVRERAGEQQQRAAQGLRSVGRQLHEMSGATEPGMASELVAQVGDRADAVAGFLEGRDPGSLLEEVKDFARRRPGVFIAAALGAGILAGRLVKSMSAGDSTDDSTGMGADQNGIA